MEERAKIHNSALREASPKLVNVLCVLLIEGLKSHNDRSRTCGEVVMISDRNEHRALHCSRCSCSLGFGACFAVPLMKSSLDSFCIIDIIWVLTKGRCTNQNFNEWFPGIKYSEVTHIGRQRSKSSCFCFPRSLGAVWAFSARSTSQVPSFGLPARQHLCLSIMSYQVLPLVVREPMPPWGLVVYYGFNMSALDWIWAQHWSINSPSFRFSENSFVLGICFIRLSGEVTFTL